MMLPLVSLVTTRHKHIHTHKRKLWDQGFSIKGELGISTQLNFTSLTLILLFDSAGGLGAQGL